MKSSQFILRLLRWVNSLLWEAKNVYNGYKRVLSQTCQSTLAKWNVHWILTVNNFTSYLRKPVRAAIKLLSRLTQHGFFETMWGWILGGSHKRRELICWPNLGDASFWSWQIRRRRTQTFVSQETSNTLECYLSSSACFNLHS